VLAYLKDWVPQQEDGRPAESSGFQPFQNCAKIVPKPLITVLQNMELDKEKVLGSNGILDVTIRTQSSTSRLCILMMRFL
jgi:hypothetical protein